MACVGITSVSGTWEVFGNFRLDTKRKKTPTVLTNTPICADGWVPLAENLFQSFCGNCTHCPMATLTPSHCRNYGHSYC